MATPLGSAPRTYTETIEERTRSFRVDCRDSTIPKICIDRELKIIKTFADNSTETSYTSAARPVTVGTRADGTDGTEVAHYPSADGGLHAYLEVSWAAVATKPGSFQMGQSTVYWSDLDEIVAFVLDTLAADNKEAKKLEAINQAITQRQRELAIAAAAATAEPDPTPEPDAP